MDNNSYKLNQPLDRTNQIMKKGEPELFPDNLVVSTSREESAKCHSDNQHDGPRLAPGIEEGEIKPSSSKSNEKNDDLHHESDNSCHTGSRSSHVINSDIFEHRPSTTDACQNEIRTTDHDADGDGPLLIATEVLPVEPERVIHEHMHTTHVVVEEPQSLHDYSTRCSKKQKRFLCASISMLLITVVALVIALLMTTRQDPTAEPTTTEDPTTDSPTTEGPMTTLGRYLAIEWIGVIDNGQGENSWDGTGDYGHFFVKLFNENEKIPQGSFHIEDYLPRGEELEGDKLEDSVYIWTDGGERNYFQPKIIHQWESDDNEDERKIVLIYEDDPTWMGVQREDDVLFAELVKRQDFIKKKKMYYVSTKKAPTDAIKDAELNPNYHIWSTKPDVQKAIEKAWESGQLEDGALPKIIVLFVNID